MTGFNYYNNIAPIYDRTRWMTESVSENVADFMIKLVDATSETSFLEVGVGTGLNVLPLVKKGYRVTGIDISWEMLAQFRQKFAEIPQNLTLLQGDASQLPFSDQSFHVVLTVHMLHTVPDGRAFFNDIDRILKPDGFYLNAQWITPPARREFENYFRTILSKYQKTNESKLGETSIAQLNVEQYFLNQGYRSNYFVAKEWIVNNSVEELLDCFKLRAYGLCWQVSEAAFALAIEEFTEFCLAHYGSLKTELSSTAKFEIDVYTRSS